MFFLIFGLIVSYFVRSPSLNESPEKTSDQTVIDALKEASFKASITV